MEIENNLLKCLILPPLAKRLGEINKYRMMRACVKHFAIYQKGCFMYLHPQNKHRL